MDDPTPMAAWMVKRLWGGDPRCVDLEALWSTIEKLKPRLDRRVRARATRLYGIKSDTARQLADKGRWIVVHRMYRKEWYREVRDGIHD